MSDQVTAGNASDVQVIPAGKTEPAPQTSGPTHAQSGANGPDPTMLRATLEKNLAAAAQKATEATNAAKAPKQDVSRETPPAASGGTPQRGPDGKFLSANAGAANAADPGKTAVAAVAGDAETVDPSAPPASWRAEAKALWPKLLSGQPLTPEESRVIVEENRKRENDFKSGILAKDGELRSIKPQFEEFQNIIKPDVEQWKAQGLSPVQAVNHLLNLGRNFRTNPVGTIQWLAKSAGLTPQQIFGAGQNQQQGQPAGGNTDPQLQPWQQEINGLKQQLHTLSNGFTQQTQSAAASEIQAFIDETGQDGQPLRPHFNDAFQHIQRLMPVIKAEHPGWTPRQVVNEAYESAVALNPETRAKLLAAGNTQAAAAQDAAARQRAAEVAARSATNGSSPNKLNGAPDPKNLRATLASKMGVQEGRV